MGARDFSPEDQFVLWWNFLNLFSELVGLELLVKSSTARMP